MREYTLKNDFLTLKISEHGAEIKSLVRNYDNKELMWQADPKFWGRTSPVLFPLVGNYWEKKSLYDGKVYEMSQHGFARDMDFHLVKSDEHSLWFELKENDETLKKYPFYFGLRIGYKIKDDKVKVIWKVKNTGNRSMYFSIGGHPAFNCDLNNSKLLLKKGDEKLSENVICGVLDDAGSGCLSDNRMELTLNKGKMHLSDELFAKDALIIENRQADSVTLIDSDNKKVLKVKFDSPLFGLWSPAGKKAPFVCIEPWYGRCDRVGFSQKLEDREYGMRLQIGEEFKASYKIKVY
ncbi:aldose 1-epimerase family protein [Butyrivibrio sp. YAB3001]|uniref:aldose 1-epimerase family protein n=1 Tax=Butyrivibrio sp. YAB3001 TaxID=1520812 RepID=UPI0008F65CFE|nr:aldose 1-epimerase family protein [Butyrivibrio sp. YAB3001]SFB68259.1 Galactose mutarotase [Butyrivibrio sp. YAB3001]